MLGEEGVDAVPVGILADGRLAALHHLGDDRGREAEPHVCREQLRVAGTLNLVSLAGDFRRDGVAGDELSPFLSAVEAGPSQADRVVDAA
jgi:hypothetical protein